MYTIELPWWVMLLPVMAIAVCLYFALRNRVSLWLLIPLVIVLAPVGVLVLNVGAMFFPYGCSRSTRCSCCAYMVA